MLQLSNHTGSHIDVPLHKIAGGASLDDVPLESFVGPAVIADLRALGPDAPIGAEALQERLPGDLNGLVVLLATGWGEKRALTDEWRYRAPFLSPDGAEWLRARGIRGVGIDHYSVGGAEEPRNGVTHDILLGAGIWIVEELSFTAELFTLPAPLQFWALPINLQGRYFGAWCRPIVVVEQDR